MSKILRLQMIILALVILGLTSPGPAGAEVARQITWDDLVPPGADPVDPLTELPTDERYRLGFVANLLYLKSLGQVEDGNPAITEAAEYMVDLRKKGIDVDGYLARFEEFRLAIEARDSELNQALDGNVVRIPGYLLPLEFDGTVVSEFLLVPYVGACIHAPPPPPNQIVHVKIAEGFSTDQIYTPVWVTGQMSAQHSSRSLSLVDGTADIAVGYEISGGSVELYKE